MVSKARAEMTEEEIEIERSRARKRAYLKSQGRGGYVDAGPMQARIRKLHDVHQITFDRIAEKTGVDLAAIKAHYRGAWYAYRPDRPITTCTWATANAVMTTPFGPADVGRLVRSTGTQRRLRALVAAGYSQRFLADATGRPLARLNHFLVRGSALVSQDYVATVEQVYRKYIHTDPLDVGVPPRSKSYAFTLARKHGYEPAICWDEDTIDDPAAWPEWTGACNTPEGYRIHVRDHIPLCSACKLAVEVRPVRRETLTFRHETFTSEMRSRGVTIKDMAERTGLSPDGILRWRTGERTPRYRVYVERCAEVLGIDPEDLMDVAPPEGEPTREVNPPGLFNAHVFGVVLDLHAIPKRVVALTLGLNEGSIEQWMSGKCRPKSPDVLNPLLAQVGMEVEEFYQ